MAALIILLLNLGASLFKPKSRLEAENAALRQHGSERDLAQCHIRGDRIKANDEDRRVRTCDHRLNALPPLLEGVDVCPVDQWLESTSPPMRESMFYTVS